MSIVRMTKEKAQRFVQIAQKDLAPSGDQRKAIARVTEGLCAICTIPLYTYCAIM